MALVVLDNEVHKELKVAAAKAERTMKELVNEILRGWFNGNRSVAERAN